MSEKHYEIIFIVSGKFQETEAATVAENVKKLISEESGRLTANTALGRKKFAYPISHQKHGFYFVYEFDLDGERLKKITHELKLIKTDVLRFLIIQKQPPAVAEIIRQKITPPTKFEKIKVAQKKISLEDLDKKLDELLDKEIVQ